MYDKHNLFSASIKERFALSKQGSSKKTLHLSLDLSGSGITYEAGDSVGIYPRHDPEVVARNLNSMQATGEELVLLKNEEHPLTFLDYLTSRANLSDISPKLLRETAARQPQSDKKQELERLLAAENHELLKEYQEQHHVWDFLEMHSEVLFSPQELAHLLMPLLPRFYSIASSQKVVGDEIHLAVACVEYASNGYLRQGICTHYLSTLAKMHHPEVRLFIQPSHSFRLPQDSNVPLIMIGPGTGVAPFRAFIQERLIHRDTRSPHWLFFGEWNSTHDFFYEEEWRNFEKQGNFRLSLAFSRDQEEKIYVQHRMREQGRELFDWLEKGAYLYICGDAKKMAKEVDAALHEIVEQHGFTQHPERSLQAKEYIKCLKKQKRYLRDVY